MAYAIAVMLIASSAVSPMSRSTLSRSALGARAMSRMGANKLAAVTRAPPGSLTTLCEISKEACDAVEPMLKAFYAKITSGDAGDSTKKKADATFFTIADGILQNMFVDHLLAGDKFGQIVGEEDGSKINLGAPSGSAAPCAAPRRPPNATRDARGALAAASSPTCAPARLLASPRVRAQ
jgi:hypothetical protein